jgi:DNA-binding CsgD family transcriptional regulator
VGHLLRRMVGHLLRRMVGHLLRRMVGHLLRRMVGGGSHGVGMDALSDRELEVFQWIGRGLSIPEIAERLKVSPKTVETHRAHIKDKLDLANSAEVMRAAVQWSERPSRA